MDGSRCVRESSYRKDSLGCGKGNRNVFDIICCIYICGISISGWYGIDN